MKKIIKKLLTIMAVVIIIGCTTTKETTSTSQVIKAVPPIPWIRDTDPYITPGDPINFFNEYQIDIYGKITKEIDVLNNGTVYPIDSSQIILIVVPARTMGEFTKVIRDERGKALVMTIRFKIDDLEYFSSDDYLDDNSINYEFNFFFYPKKNLFTLSGNKQIIIDGIIYDVKLKIHGNGDKFCRLLSNYHPVDRTQYRTESIEGVDPTIGEKIIVK